MGKTFVDNILNLFLNRNTSEKKETSDKNLEIKSNAKGSDTTEPTMDSIQSLLNQYVEEPPQQEEKTLAPEQVSEAQPQPVSSVIQEQSEPPEDSKSTEIKSSETQAENESIKESASILHKKIVMPKISFTKLKEIHSKIDFDFDKLIPEGSEVEDLQTFDRLTFDKVFEYAKIKPPKEEMSLIHLAKAIEEIKDDPKYSKHTREQIRDIALQIMKSHKVNESDMLQDALLRDKALDTYEEFLAERIKNRREGLMNENSVLEEKIKKNNKQIEQEEAYLERWIKDKEFLEERMLMACGYIGDITGQSVTIGAVTRGEVGRSQYKKE